MNSTNIVPATADHVAALLPNIREADVAEFIAASGQTPVEVLEHALRVSTRAWAGVVKGEVIGIFGVAPSSLIGGRGTPWLVGSTLIERNYRIFLRNSRPVVSEFLSLYPHLENFVDQRNHVAKAWLHWLGFHLEDPTPYGVQGLPFHRFHMEKK
ncbi:hypothetical protein ACG1VR_10515 [Cedecea davisae]|uniref:hypothetical protein n=1 Tax=Cedecea davisae TaxID=158484 RepID=UPI00376F3DC0